MINASEIHEQLVRFLVREIALNKFERWFAQNTWNIHLHGNESAQELTYAIELRLSEHSSGHLTDDELRKELLPFAERYTADISLGDIDLGSEPVSATSSDSTLVLQQLDEQLLTVS